MNELPITKPEADGGVALPQPCSETCPKCGSNEILRRHRNPGDEWWDYLESSPKSRSTPWVVYSGRQARVKKECITHQCKICRWQWESDCLQNDPSSATRPTRACDCNRDVMAGFAGAHGWAAVCDDNLPPLDEIVWLWDGHRIWIGGRADDCDGWLWGNTYGTIWHNGAKWDGDLETDDDYKPTHWMRLTEPPNAKTEPRL